MVTKCTPRITFGSMALYEPSDLASCLIDKHASLSWPAEVQAEALSNDLLLMGVELTDVRGDEFAETVERVVVELYERRKISTACEVRMHIEDTLFTVVSAFLSTLESKSALEHSDNLELPPIGSTLTFLGHLAGRGLVDAEKVQNTLQQICNAVPSLNSLLAFRTLVCSSGPILCIGERRGSMEKLALALASRSADGTYRWGLGGAGIELIQTCIATIWSWLKTMHGCYTSFGSAQDVAGLLVEFEQWRDLRVSAESAQELVADAENLEEVKQSHIKNTRRSKRGHASRRDRAPGSYPPTMAKVSRKRLCALREIQSLDEKIYRALATAPKKKIIILRYGLARARL